MTYMLADTVSLLKEGFGEIGSRFAGILMKRPKAALLSGVTLTVLVAIFVIILQSHTSVNATSNQNNKKYYTTVQVECGDTLWDIAGEYITSEYSSMDDYIKEVEQINHISGDSIKSGCYLVVPYYAEAPLTEAE